MIVYGSNLKTVEYYRAPFEPYFLKKVIVICFIWCSKVAIEATTLLAYVLSLFVAALFLLLVQGSRFKVQGARCKVQGARYMV